MIDPCMAATSLPRLTERPFRPLSGGMLTSC